MTEARMKTGKQVDILREWNIFQLRVQFKTLTLLAIASFLLMIPIDFLTLSTDIAKSFAPLRLLLACLLLLTVALTGIMSQLGGNLDKYLPLFVVMAASIPTVGFPLFYLTPYAGELVEGITIGALTTMLIAHFFLAKFNRVYRGWYLILLGSLLVYRFSLQVDVAPLLASHLIAILFGEYLGRSTRKQVGKRYESLKRIVPLSIARRLVVSDRALSEQEFSPKQRQCVCIVADWRRFQQLTQDIANDRLARLFEEYYDYVYKGLRACDASEEYYIDWHADELFIILYQENKDWSQIKERALAMVEFLTHDAHQFLNRMAPQPIMFDIGVSVGEGLIGIMGPKGGKKLTIASPVAGRAKRLESEAKQIRSSSTSEVNMPIAVFDFPPQRPGQMLHFKKIVAVSKDIAGEEVFVRLDNPGLGKELESAEPEAKLKLLRTLQQKKIAAV